MSKFKIGDKVTVRDCYLGDGPHEVVEIDDEGEVTFTNGDQKCYSSASQQTRPGESHYIELCQPESRAELTAPPEKVTYTTVTTITSSDGHTFTETEIDGKPVEELKAVRSLLARHARLFKKAS